ncbi:MAG: mechanosensitive ion channel domain-containing protein [Planctomycetota bacterium]|nr:mechanosensitive ion channel domain-containing protein [Planctomycetota bacterium]
MAGRRAKYFFREISRNGSLLRRASSCTLPAFCAIALQLVWVGNNIFAQDANQSRASVPAQAEGQSAKQAGQTELQRQQERLTNEISARAAALPSSALTPEQKAEVAKLDAAVMAALQSAGELAEKTQQQTTDAASAKSRIEAARAEKARLSQAKPKSDVTWLRLDYQAGVAESQALGAQISTLELRRTDLSSVIAGREKRRQQLAQLISDAKSAREQVAAAKPTFEKSATTLLQQSVLAEWEARQLQAAQQVGALESELLLIDVESPLLPLQLETLQIQEKLLKEEQSELNDAMKAKRSARIFEFHDEFSELAADDTEVHARLKYWLEVIAKEESAAEELTWLSLAQQHDQLQLRIESMDKEMKRWRVVRDNMQLRLDPSSNKESIPGANGWVVKRLREQRKELPSAVSLMRDLAEIYETVQLAQSLDYDLTDLSNQLEILQDTDRADPRLEDIGRRVLSAMKEDVRVFLNDLYKLGDLTEETLRLSNEYQAFIDKQLFWTPNADLLSLGDLADTSGASIWLISPANWTLVVAIVLDDARQYPFWWIAFALALLLLGMNRVRLQQSLEKVSVKAHRNTCTDFDLSLRGLADTVLISVPFPLILLFVAWRLNVSAEGDSREFCTALSAGLMLATAALFPMSLLRQICVPQGLGRMHFGWGEAQTRQLHQHLRWLINFSVPLLLVIGALVAQSEAKWEESLGRIAFLVLMVLLSVFFGFIFHPRRGVFAEILQQRSGGWLDRLRFIWYPSLSVAPVALGVLSTLGYHYTSQQLATRLDRTLWMIVLLTVTYCLMRRWLLLNRRKIMMDQARQRLEEAAKLREQGQQASTPIKGVEDEEVNLVAINEQTRRLIKSLFVTCGLLWAYWIWADVLPAILVLDRVAIWPLNETESISLADLLLVVPILVLTVIATRNVPGLLEIALLQHLPLARAARYAITTLASYAIAALGLVLASANIGLTWASIQWLVAGLGVGLGFGMQEIFANFISGVILLFEQPIRVGDVVTIDGTTGTVARIRIRATTIVNWDRQELIVPNKELITGKLINWTLSDTTNRVVVNVGIAYGSDTKEACDAVKEICSQHPNIMKDPGPIVTFEGFGDNTLNLVLRAYLATLDNRLSTVHQLHEQIYQEFDRRKIEIAFPQLDLHLRSMPEQSAGGVSS